MLSLTPIGKITKVHGAQGELKARIDEAYLEALYNADFVFVNQAGKPVPFFVEEIRGEKYPILKLEEIDSPQAALPLTSMTISLESQLIEEFGRDASNHPAFGMLSGYLMYDLTSGKRGTIKEVLEYPQQELAAVVDEEKNEFLIPLHDELIDTIQVDKKTVVVRLPEGLFEL